VEIQNADGSPVPGFGLADADELFGDSVEQVVSWAGRTDVSSLKQAVRLRIVVSDADVFSYQFVD
jgi:hypothetical protein